MSAPLKPIGQRPKLHEVAKAPAQVRSKISSPKTNFVLARSFSPSPSEQENTRRSTAGKRGHKTFNRIDSAGLDIALPCNGKNRESQSCKSIFSPWNHPDVLVSVVPNETSALRNIFLTTDLIPSRVRYVTGILAIDFILALKHIAALAYAACISTDPPGRNLIDNPHCAQVIAPIDWFQHPVALRSSLKRRSHDHALC